MDEPESFPRTIDHFRVVAPLGSGGMGVVYRAEDLLLHRPVALKVMRPEQVADAQRRARFLREARTAASLVHPNVATIYEVGEADGTIFIAMELVPGKSLRDVLSVGPVDARRAQQWSIGIARALARAHEAGIVHRDLKPDNVMVLPDDEVKLLDFGIAKALAAQTGETSAPSDTMTAEGLVLGTPAYVSPEQARGEALDVRSDVFSFGTMLYEMLTGVSPFQRGSVLDTLTAVAREPVTSLRRLARATPVELDTIVSRCLEKDREARFAGGAPLLAALEAVTVGEFATEPLPALATPPGERARSLSAPTSTESTFAPTGALPTSARNIALPARRMAIVAALLAAVTAGAFAVRARRRLVSPPNTPAPTELPCTSNAACAREHQGAWKCNQARHQCVSISSEDCRVQSEPSDSYAEDTVWFGALYPTTGPEAPSAASERNAVELARREFVDALSGSYARQGDLHARPIAVVMCDEAADPIRASRHLADDVEVPAVLGFRWTKTALDTIPSIFLPHHILSMVTLSQSPAISQIPQEQGEARLVWHPTLNHTEAVRPMAAFIEQVLEPRAHPPGDERRQTRVAFVRPTAAASDFSDALYRSLRFNGKPALENHSGFRQFAYQPGAENRSVVAQLLEFAPDIVALQGFSVLTDVIESLESSWTKGRRPSYVTTGVFSDKVAQLIGNDPARRARFFFITNLGSTMTNAQLVLHYNFAFPEEPVTWADAPQPSYDAFFLLAFASEASATEQVTGAYISQALTRLLPPGPRVEVGPDQILSGFRTLRESGRIDLVGALGSLDFDIRTGEAPVDYAILCSGTDENGHTNGWVESGVTFTSSSGELHGSLECR